MVTLREIKMDYEWQTWKNLPAFSRCVIRDIAPLIRMQNALMKVLCLWICKKDKKVVIQVFKDPPQRYFPINVRACAILFFKRAVKICVGKIKFMSKVNVSNNNHWDINLSSNSDVNKNITVSYFFCSSHIWVFRIFTLINVQKTVKYLI